MRVTSMAVLLVLGTGCAQSTPVGVTEAQTPIDHVVLVMQEPARDARCKLDCP